MVSVNHPVFTSTMIRYLLSRIGCLMIIAGSLLLVLGIAAERSEQPAFDYLILGIALFFIGLLLWSKLRQKQPRPRRFSIFQHRDRDEKKNSDHGWEDRHYD